MILIDASRYDVAPGALMGPTLTGEFIAYSDACAIVQTYATALEALRKTLHDEVNERAASDIKLRAACDRMLERAQRAERQVINAARALGYIDDAG